MCRRNHLLGCSAVCFGIGLLTGSGLESGLLCVCIGVGVIMAGLGMLRHK